MTEKDSKQYKYRQEIQQVCQISAFTPFSWDIIASRSFASAQWHQQRGQGISSPCRPVQRGHIDEGNQDGTKGVSVCPINYSAHVAAFMKMAYAAAWADDVCER